MRAVFSRRFGLSAALFSLAMSLPALGAPTDLSSPPAGKFAGVDLVWERRGDAQECIDAQALAAAVGQRLSRPVFVESGADLELVGNISGSAGAWLGRIEVRTASGESLGVREVRSRAEHCSSLDESMVLVTALLADVPREELAERTSPAKALDKQGSEPRRADAPKSGKLVVPRDTHAPRRPWRFEAGAAAGTALGLVPGLGLGAELQFGIEPPAFWYFELAASLWLERDETLGALGGRFALREVSLRICPFRWARQVALRGCIEHRLGVLSARGFGFDEDRAEDRLAASLGARVDLTYPERGLFAVALGLGVTAPVLRDRFVFLDQAGQHAIYERPPVSAVGALGLRLRL